MKRQLDLAEFHKLARAGTDIPGAMIRLALTSEPTVHDSVRVATFVFSDNSVDRYGDTIDARGWILDKFLANPVALFGHDSGSVENVIGKARNVRVEGQRLIGEIEFMEASVNPTAETVFQMVKGGYLNAVSVGFAPIEWSLAKDKSRPQGVDFKKQELLEISVVPIPANPSALVQARAAGIEVDRLAFTAPAAAAAPKVVKSLWHVAWLADILMDLDMLEDCVEWEAAMEEDGSPIAEKLTGALQALGQILIDMTVEEVNELLADEEGEGVTLVVADPVELALKPARLKLLKSLVKADVHAVRAVIDALAPKDKALSMVDLIAIKASVGAALKAGRVLSSDNEKKLRDAHAQIASGCEAIMGVVGSATADEPEPDEAASVVMADEQKTADRARRERIAKARKHQAAAV
jgi:HK97 family phage prohead protease